MITFLTVVGGLALFLYGVRILSQGMEHLAGGKIQQWLDKVTNRPIKGAAFGAVATALLQSSSMLMVTMIGLINGNLLSLEQAIGVMLGQEIGTTFTGQMIAFKIGDIRFVAIALGLILLEFSEKRNTQRYGQILLGFGILFTGMETMAGALQPLAETPMVAAWLTTMGQSPLLGVVAGALLTALIQSSSAMTGLVIAMGSTGVITLPGAIGLIYGANIGTCVTGFIASTRSSVPARRASIAQIIINVLGVLIFLPFITPFANLLEGTSSSLPRQIANSHTVFNVAVSLILFPFVRQISRITKLIVPDKPGDQVSRVTQYIDDHLMGVPSIAISEAAKELDRMGRLSLEMVRLGMQALLDLDMVAAEQVLTMEREQIDPLCDAIETFVDSIVAEQVDRNERTRCFQIKNINVDLERVADHAENMAEAAQDRVNHHVDFSDEAIADLRRCAQHATHTLETALDALRAGDQRLALQACRLEDDMDRVALDTRSRHMVRIQDGTCDSEASVIFVETLRNLERVGDHADNVAVSVVRKSYSAEAK